MKAHGINDEYRVKSVMKGFRQQKKNMNYFNTYLFISKIIFI